MPNASVGALNPGGVQTGTTTPLPADRRLSPVECRLLLTDLREMPQHLQRSIIARFPECLVVDP